MRHIVLLSQDVIRDVVYQISRDLKKSTVGKVCSERNTDMHLESPLGPERQGAKITPHAPVRSLSEVSALKSIPLSYAPQRTPTKSHSFGNTQSCNVQFGACSFICCSYPC